ncbi:MAG: DUF2283 domain-containing protein [Gammaproteobacteria bacterium]|nr:DUF2283 domain-containing protein [Gammaproteobacteria bacterium]
MMKVIFDDLAKEELQEQICMVEKHLEEKSISYLLAATSSLLKLSRPKMWIDYDKTVDVLYVHFEEHPASTYSEMRDDGVIFDYREDALVGLTILEASHR